jgi:uncharacterized membrane protein YgcG
VAGAILPPTRATAGPVLAGEAFSPRQRDEIVRAIQLAQQMSGLRFSVYVGPVTGEPREHARRLHAELGADAPRSVLVLVDPANRSLEIVTGSEARRWLDDRSCALGSLAMTSSFAAGDLAGGIARGLQVLGEHARHPRSLHTGELPR